MPGSIRVSVFEIADLPSNVIAGKCTVIKVSLGKREYQTNPAKLFTGTSQLAHSEFLFPVVNLRDNLVVAVLDGKGEVVAKSEIETPTIVQRGSKDEVVQLRAGGEIRLKLSFVLTEEERKKIEQMRTATLRKKKNFVNQTRQTAGHRNVAVSSVKITEITSEEPANMNADKENQVTNKARPCQPGANNCKSSAELASKVLKDDSTKGKEDETTAVDEKNKNEDILMQSYTVAVETGGDKKAQVSVKVECLNLIDSDDVKSQIPKACNVESDNSDLVASPGLSNDYKVAENAVMGYSTTEIGNGSPAMVEVFDVNAFDIESILPSLSKSGQEKPVADETRNTAKNAKPKDLDTYRNGKHPVEMRSSPSIPRSKLCEKTKIPWKSSGLQERFKFEGLRLKRYTEEENKKLSVSREKTLKQQGRMKDQHHDIKEENILKHGVVDGNFSGQKKQETMGPAIDKPRRKPDEWKLIELVPWYRGSAKVRHSSPPGSSKFSSDDKSDLHPGSTRTSLLIKENIHMIDKSISSGPEVNIDSRQATELASKQVSKEKGIGSKWLIGSKGWKQSKAHWSQQGANDNKDALDSAGVERTLQKALNKDVKAHSETKGVRGAIRQVLSGAALAAGAVIFWPKRKVTSSTDKQERYNDVQHLRRSQATREQFEVTEKVYPSSRLWLH